MVVIVPTEWVARAEEEAPEYGFTTEELLGVWARYPAWGPGGRYYGRLERLPSSQSEGTIEVYCQEPPMKFDPVCVAVWSFAWAGAAGMCVLIVWGAWLLWGAL